MKESEKWVNFQPHVNNDKYLLIIAHLEIQTDTVLITQIAYEYSQKKYSEFAVVAQPGFRDGTAHRVPIGFLSSVRQQGQSKLVHHTLVVNLPKGLTDMFYSSPLCFFTV